jgi:hypothetical protein
MTRARTLVWLIAVIAFAVPSFGTVGASHAMAPPLEVGVQVASLDCPDHPPPPDCPAQGTAKHAAGQCCPQMAGAVALLLPGATAEVPVRAHTRVIAAAATLTILFLAQEPPPPRV